MSFYDPAWDMPEENWQPQGSYNEAVAVPASAPDAGTLLCLPPVSQDWLPLIIGCLDQLTIPYTWGAIPDATMQQVLSWVEQLKLMVSEASPCCTLRWDPDSCNFQTSSDGGATWTTISGWTIASMAACVQQPLIDIGGAPGTGVNGPYPPPGTSTAQAACNIANWLGVEILQASMSSLATSIGATATTLEAALALFGLAATMTGVGGVFFDAAGIFIGAGTAIGETALNTAAGDATLRSDLICAIYSAISADGKVTSGNFGTVLTNINAISYATPGIVGLLHDYVSNLGFSGVNAIQSEGALYDGSCACGDTPIPGGTSCAVFNGINDYLTAVAGLLTGTGPFSVCAWVYSTSENTQYVCAQVTSATTHHDFAAGLFFEGSFIQPAIDIGDNNGSDYRETWGNNEFPTSGWHHVAWVWSDEASVSIYLDGTLQGNSHVTGSGGFTTQNAGVFGVGAAQASPSLVDFLVGKMADLRVYSGSLSSGQVAAIYGGGVTGYVAEGSPVGWWAFNDASGGSAHDYGSGHHDLTWHGTGAHWGTV